MQNPLMDVQYGVPIPPPPPIRPLVTETSSKNVAKKVEDKLKMFDIHSSMAHLLSEDNPSSLFSFYMPVNFVLQNGRNCGIVALSMASQLIQKVDPEIIFTSAFTRGFTKWGELFSAYNVAKLASDLLNCGAEVVNELCVSKNCLLNYICDGCPLLIPYDADKNHFPCSNKGHSAHWATVTGLCFSLSDSINTDDLLKDAETKNVHDTKVHHIKNGHRIKSYLKHAENVHVYAHQGKSKHLALWDLNRLLESNLNLHEVTKKYAEDELVLPENGALSELRDKIVVLKKRSF